MWKRFPAHILLEQQFYTRKELPAGQASEPDFSCPKTTQHSIIAGTLRYIAVDAACDHKIPARTTMPANTAATAYKPTI